MSEIVFFLEEPSVQAMLEGVLPRLLPPDTPVRYIVFEGKQDLDKQLERRLRGYRTPGARFVILRDKDAADCRALKNQLREKCRAAGKTEVLIRIACHELESWYLADLSSVATAFDIGNVSGIRRRAKYRTPHDLANASEELKKITNGEYQKISGSRVLGVLLDLDNTTSHSFAAFVTGVRRLVSVGVARTIS